MLTGCPQPLPLPESSHPSRRDASPNRPLPSPNEVSSRGLEFRDWDNRDRDSGEKDNRDRGDAFIADGNGRFTHQEFQKSPEHALSRKFLNRCLDNYRNGQIQHAPKGSFSSPVISRQSHSMGGIYQSHNMAVHGFQGWSDPEMPAFDMVLGFSSLASPERTVYGVDTDSSLLHSPKMKSLGRSAKSRSGPASPLDPKLARHEDNCHGKVHPLPLPPGPVLSSPATAKIESLPITSQWQKGKLIGRGSFGSVYVATNRETGALCAMKEVEILLDDPKSEECMKQLQQEIKVLSQLKHPNIVQYYGSEIIGDTLYIYLEYVYPGSINKYAREHCGAITESVVRNFSRHILSGLAYLHSTKTIHRDIKGANLLVDASGVVKLADFGMAKHLSGQSADLSLKGSPYWMAPEILLAMMQKDSNSDHAFAVDIWSLGCTIIEMLDGKPPWSEFEGAAAMFKVLRETPPLPETLSSEGKDFLRCCFQRNPAERPLASKLLEHPFLRNSMIHEIPACTQALNEVTLMDKARSSEEHSNSKNATQLMCRSTKGGTLKKAASKSFSFTHMSLYTMRLLSSRELKAPKAAVLP